MKSVKYPYKNCICHIFTHALDLIYSLFPDVYENVHSGLVHIEDIYLQNIAKNIAEVVILQLYSLL